MCKLKRFVEFVRLEIGFVSLSSSGMIIHICMLMFSFGIVAHFHHVVFLLLDCSPFFFFFQGVCRVTSSSSSVQSNIHSPCKR